MQNMFNVRYRYFILCIFKPWSASNAGDYRQTAALSILKVLVEESNGYFADVCGLSSQYAAMPPHSSAGFLPTSSNSRPASASAPASSSLSQVCPVVPERAVILAISSCEAFLGSIMHEDIGEPGSQLVGVASNYSHILLHVCAYLPFLVSYYCPTSLNRITDSPMWSGGNFLAITAL